MGIEKFRRQAICLLADIEKRRSHEPLLAIIARKAVGSYAVFMHDPQ